MRRRFGPGSERSALDAAIAALDLTTLEGRDTPQTVLALCARAAAPGPGVPPVAAVCVYPALVAAAVAALRGTGVAVASVRRASPPGSCRWTCGSARSARRSRRARPKSTS